MEHPAVDHGIERAGVAGQLGGVTHCELDIDSGVAGSPFGGGQRGGRDVQPGHLVAVPGEVDRVVTEPAPDVEHVAVHPAAGVPADDIVLGRFGVPRRCRDRREALAGAFATVERVEIYTWHAGQLRRRVGG